LDTRRPVVIPRLGPISRATISQNLLGSDIASDVGTFMQMCAPGRVLASIGGIGGCAQSKGGLGLTPALVRRHSEAKSLYGNRGFGAKKTGRWHDDLMLVSMNPVILFTNGGHWYFGHS